jgi:hypothetical protein
MPIDPEELSLGIQEDENKVEAVLSDHQKKEMDFRKSRFRIAIKKEASYIASTRMKELVDSVREGK